MTTEETRDDYEAVRHLVARWAHLLDQRSFEEVAACWSSSPDASLHSEGKQYTGREDIRAYLESSTKASDRALHLRHKLSSLCISVNGTTATSSVYVDVDHLDLDTGTVEVVSGRYDDRLVKEAGQWLLIERRVGFPESFGYSYSRGRVSESADVEVSARVEL